MQKKRSAKWDNVKFFLIFLVILGHIMEIFCKDFPLARSVFIFIYSFHMPAFFFISGMFSKRTVESESFKGEKIIPFLPLWLLLHLFRNAGLYIYNPNRSFNLLDQNNIAWFMLTMFVYYSVTWLLRQKNKKYILLISLGLSIGAGFISGIGSTLALSRILVFYPFFLLGLMTKREDLEEVFKKPSVKRASVIFIISILLIAILFEPECYFFRRMFTGQNSYYKYPGGFKGTNYLIRLGLYPFSMLMSLCFFCIIPEKKTFYTEIGKNSLSIYFWHLPFLTILYHQSFIRNISMMSGILTLFTGIVVSLFFAWFFSLKPFYSFINLFFKKNTKYKKQ